MTLSPRAAMLARLKSCAEGTIFEQQERLEGTAIAIRRMIRHHAPNATASELALIVRCFPEEFSGTVERRDVVAEFLDSFPDDLPAMRIAEGLENNHAQA